MNKPLLDYFKAKIGQSLYREVSLGKYEGGVYYTAEILAVAPITQDTVIVNVQSKDLTPSGYALGGTLRHLGDHAIPLKGLDGLEAFWRALLEQADPEYASFCKTAHCGAKQ